LVTTNQAPEGAKEDTPTASAVGRRRVPIRAPLGATGFSPKKQIAFVMYRTIIGDDPALLARNNLAQHGAAGGVLG